MWERELAVDMQRVVVSFVTTFLLLAQLSGFVPELSIEVKNLESDAEKLYL